jgi:hypothetical protein
MRLFDNKDMDKCIIWWRKKLVELCSRSELSQVNICRLSQVSVICLFTVPDSTYTRWLIDVRWLFC